MDLRHAPIVRTVTALACLIAALTFTTAGLSPAHGAAAVRGPASVHGTGTWLNDGICAPSTPPPGADLACIGRTIWHGPLLTGTTLYTASGTVTTAGDIIGRADETFTGSAANNARGTIHFTESISLTATGTVFVSADAIGGTGDFCHVTGHLDFTGIADQSGIGSGSYAGHIVTPKNCG